MVLIKKEYIIKESQAKLDKIIENNIEFVNFVSGHDFNEQQIQSIEAFTDALNREAMNKHMSFIEDVANITENFQPSPALSTSSKGNPLPKFVNRPDLAEGCTLLSEENNYTETLDFLKKIELWYQGTWPGCNDMNKRKKELYNKLSRHLKTELVNFDPDTHSFDDLRKAIMERIERKLPSKIRLLTFLTETKQRSEQTLSEYFTFAHREAAKAVLHTEGWTIANLEVIILLAGMKNTNQHQKLLLEYSDKSKLTFTDILKFANIEETVEKQAARNKSASVSSIKGGKAKGKASTQKPPAAPKESEKKKYNKCPSYRHKTEDCQSTFCDYCKRWFHTKESCRLSPNSLSYMPHFKAEDKNKTKPTATVNSIQRAQQHTTSFFQAPPPNLFQENQLNTPPPQYLPATQPAPVSSPPQPQPGPSSSQLPEIEDLQDIIDLASDTEEHTWHSNMVGCISSIVATSQSSTESPCHYGFLYYKSRKARGH